MKIKLSNVRLSFASLFNKASFNGQETKFEGTFLIDKKSGKKDIVKLQTAVKSLIAEKLEGVKLKSDKICIKDGDLEDYEGYEGTMSVKASNNVRPTIINKDKSQLSDEDGVIYSGCYVNAVIELWAQDNNYGKRINANLLGVQFVKDGDNFGTGAKVASDDDFDDISDGSEEDDDSPF